MTRHCFLAAALVALAAPPLAAQARPDSVRPDSVVPLEGVVVSTVRATTTTGGASAVVVNPDSLHVVPAPTLEEVLRVIPFVAVRENSRGEAEITVRGSDSRQVAVLVDGVPLTLGWDHRTDPSVVPLSGAQSITLIRGLHSVLYGPNVLGGVVEVGVSQGPPRPDLPTRLQLGAGFDQHGAQAYSAAAGRAYRLTSGDLMVRGGAGFRDRPGVALAGGVVDPASRHAELRGNSDVRHLDGFLATRFHHVDGQWLGVSASGYRAERGVPPELHVSEPRLWRYPAVSRLLAVASGGTGHRDTPWGRGDLEASVGIDVGASEVESFATNAYDAVVGTESGDGRTLTLRLLGDHSLGRAATLTGATTFTDVSHREGIDGEEADYRQRLWSVASEVSTNVGAAGRLSGGLALDGADTPETGGREPLGALRSWGGRLGASSLAFGDRVRLHAALSRRARFPALRELYSGALGRFEPNPALRPETLVGAEAGATLHRGDLELQAVGFHHRLSDAVVRTTTPERKFRRENLHQIRSTGLELLADWRAGGLSIMGDALLQRVRLVDPGATGPARHAENQPEVRLGLDVRAPLPQRLSALLDATYTGRQYCVNPDLGAESSVRGDTRVDLGLQRVFALAGAGPLRAARATVSLDNATDRAVYDQCGLPQPGRTLRFAIEVG